jgi:uncharacterized protein YlxW (UPF0749 family)
VTLRLAALRGHQRGSIALGAVLALAGFGVTSLTLSPAVPHRADAARRTQLIALIGDRKHQVNDLDAAIRGLRTQLAQAGAAAGRITSAEQQQAALDNLLGLQAGTVAVAGPAVVVSLADSRRAPSDLAQASAYRIHDVDLQLVVNALFASGAQAVGINGNRVVATTPIRGAGQTIVVNFRPLNRPYVVTAIAADRVGFEASDIARRFHRWTGLFGLGYSVRTTGHVVLPAYSGQLALTTASPTLLLSPPGTGGPATP